MAFRLLPGGTFFRDKSEQNCSALAHPFVRPAPGFSDAQPNAARLIAVAVGAYNAEGLGVRLRSDHREFRRRAFHYLAERERGSLRGRLQHGKEVL
jgi:hypothetical protein